MIKIIEDFEKVVPIWAETFGDSKDDIVFFCNNIRDAECIAYFDADTVVSMLFLIKCKLSGSDSYYVYAASTFKAYQNKGYMSKLLEYCIDKYKNVCLIPADETLIEYYKKRGFLFIYSVDELEFDQCEQLINEYLFEGCSLNNPIVLGNKGE